MILYCNKSFCLILISFLCYGCNNHQAEKISNCASLPECDVPNLQKMSEEDKTNYLRKVTLENIHKSDKVQAESLLFIANCDSAISNITQTNETKCSCPMMLGASLLLTNGGKLILACYGMSMTRETDKISIYCVNKDDGRRYLINYKISLPKKRDSYRFLCTWGCYYADFDKIKSLGTLTETDELTTINIDYQIFKSVAIPHEIPLLVRIGDYGGLNSNFVELKKMEEGKGE
jgi:hypothetical protein